MGLSIVNLYPRNHLFDAFKECEEVYKHGHFISTVMLTQSVNEGLLRMIAKKHKIQPKRKNQERERKEWLCTLVNSKDSPLRGIIPDFCIKASKAICDSHRNKVHHMNPTVSDLDFKEIAKENMRCLTLFHNEIFGSTPSDEPGRLAPHYPEYWNVREDGTAGAHLNYPRIAYRGDVRVENLLNELSSVAIDYEMYAPEPHIQKGLKEVGMQILKIVNTPRT